MKHIGIVCASALLAFAAHAATQKPKDIRDDFAAAALAGLAANANRLLSISGMAEESYRIADAMLLARKRDPQ